VRLFCGEGLHAEAIRRVDAPLPACAHRGHRGHRGCWVAGLLLLLIARVDVQGRVGIAYWQHQAQPCGTVYYDALDWSISAADSQAATTCFVQAYRRCRAASLVESVGTIFRSEYTYLIEPQLLALGGHACSIQLNYGYGVASASPPGWVACADVAQRWYGLHFFGCGTYGDRFVGAAPPSQSPSGVACGDIRVVQPSIVDASARDVVTCLLRARQTCQSAWAQATVTDVSEHVDRQLLLVEPSHQTCVVLELEWHGSWHGSQFLPLRHGSYHDNEKLVCPYGIFPVYVGGWSVAGGP
jgi:hypothetical protein